MEFLNGRNKNYLAGAILLPLVIAWFLVQIQFWLGATIANGIVAMLVAVLSGGFFASKISFANTSYKLLFWLLYLVCLLTSVFMVMLFTSCVNGDCI